MNFSRCIASVFLALSGVVVSAQANEAGSGSDLWLLAKYDANGDQVITMDEISLRREKRFDRLDQDADGLVSFEEYQTLDVMKRELLLKARFDKLDLDQDGQVSNEEYSSYLGSFDRFDSDGDGKLTQQEMNTRQVATAQKSADDTRCLLWLCVRTSLD